MVRLLAAAVVVLLALLAVLFIHAASLPSHQVAVEPAPRLALDEDALAERFAALLRVPTISHEGGEDTDEAAFRTLHALLAAQTPRAHAALRRETVAGLSLLYTWPGRDPSLAPLLLLGHLDVVPVESPESWTWPPFDGVVADGFVWGRGAIDDKLNVFGLLEAVEQLAAAGFTPQRTVLLAFGHDEELGGDHGAATVAALLAERGVEPELVLDEGGSIVRGVVPGFDPPLAVVGVAEKGYVSAVLEAHAEGGHSSVPPEITAIGILAEAIERLTASPMPAHLEGPVRALFERGIAPEAPLAQRLVLGNLWLFGPLLERFLSGLPQGAAMLRTTTAPTILEAGIKDNVIPSRARAVVNFRILPGDTIESTLAHVRRAVDDERVEVTALPKRREPSPASDLDSDAWRVLARSIREVFPGTVVAPYLVLGGTDARHYRPLTANVYRFQPLRLGQEDLARLHGRDERVAVDALAESVRFYARLIRNGAGG